MTPGNEKNESAGSSAQRSIIGTQDSEPSMGGNDGDMDTSNQGEGRTNESNDGRVGNGEDEDDSLT